MGNHILCSKNVLGVSILTSVTIITGALLNSIKVDAVSTSAQATVNVEEACTMNSTITTPHTATIPNGTYQADIGTTTINVICNDSQGYAIYAVGYTGDEIGGENSTKLVNATGNTNTIATGTATSGNSSNWAMKISTSGSSFVGTIDNSFGNYHAVPNEYTKVAHYNSATDAGNNATGSTYQTTYAAFVSSTQLAGNYAGKVKYTMVHPANEFVPHEVACTAGKICYNPNTAIVEGQMGQQSVNNNASVMLYAPNFKKQGYGFAGWSDAYDYETNPDANFYGPSEIITIPSSISSVGLSLYAIWIKSAGNMQDSSIATSICNSLTQSGPNIAKTLNSVSALTDTRDNDTYAIAKLADGKCWMIENLRLDDGPILSANNTHNPLLPLTNNYSLNTTSNHLSSATNPTQTAWCTNNWEYCTDQSMLATNNTTLFINNTVSSYSIMGEVYSYGNYYNWYSATAGRSPYNGTSGESVDGDICPNNWHLPTGGNNGGNFATLSIALGGDGSYQTGETGLAQYKGFLIYPSNYVNAGFVDGSMIKSINGGGDYWSSTRNGVNAYYLMLHNNGVDPAVYFSGSGDTGKTVRCIAGT